MTLNELNKANEIQQYIEILEDKTNYIIKLLKGIEKDLKYSDSKKIIYLELRGYINNKIPVNQQRFYNFLKQENNHDLKDIKHLQNELENL